MLVYRVENAHGRGPYVAAPDWHWMEVEHNADTGHPGPHQDDGELRDYWLRNKYDAIFGRAPEHIKFGFISIDQMLRWFSAYELFTLAQCGFGIATYRVELVHTSSRQCAFHCYAPEDRLEYINILAWLDLYTQPK